MADMILLLGDFSAVVEPPGRQEGVLAQLSGYWTTAIVAEILNPYRLEPLTALVGDDATAALPE